MYIDWLTWIIIFIIVQVILNNWGGKRILQFSQRNDKSPLTQWKQVNYQAIPIYTSSSIEILVLSFYFPDFLCITPHPIEMSPPIWLHVSTWTAYASSIDVKISCMLDVPITLISFILFSPNTKFSAVSSSPFCHSW